MKRELAEIEWADAFGVTDTYWQGTVKGFPYHDHDPFVCRTTGYIVNISKNYVWVAQTIGPGDSMGGVFAIPISMITKKRRIKWAT